MINCCQSGLGTVQKVARKLAGLEMGLAPAGFAHSAHSCRHASLIHFMESHPTWGPRWLAWNYMAQTKHIKFITANWSLAPGGCRATGRTKNSAAVRMLEICRWRYRWRWGGFSTDSNMGVIMQLKWIDLMA